jgi:hypothetical protein
MSASEVDICNGALLSFGDVRITALNEASTQARACNVWYPLIRDKLLASHPWNFAMTRADISAQVSPAPPFGWSCAYNLPADCLRVWEFWGYTGTWIVEDGQLKTDAEEEIYIRYIKKVEATGKFSPAFVMCLVSLLGANLAAKLAGNSTRKMELLEQHIKVDLPHAYHINAIEGNRPLHEDEAPMDSGNFTWQTEGR